jgi:hypothetical protein
MMDPLSATPADTDSNWVDVEFHSSKKIPIIDMLMMRKSKPRIMSGGPDKDGKWAVIVEYIHDGLCAVKLSLQELRDWRKRS